MKGKLLTAVLLTAFMAQGVSASVSPGLGVLAGRFEMAHSGSAGGEIAFSAEDFSAALGLSEIERLEITALPEASSGRMMLGERYVEDGQVINARDIGELRFIPNGVGETEACFGFRVPDYTENYVCRVFALERVNRAPVVNRPEAIESGAFEGLDYLGSVTASDPDGDRLKFEVTSEPKNGSVSFTSPELGYYVYTPSGDFVGRDSFTVCAVDDYGARSGNVRITIDVAKSVALPEDVDGHWSAGAVSELAKVGIIETDEPFCPDEPMSRAQFLDFMMRAAGHDRLASANTCFADDASIPESMKGSIALASALGIVSGIETDSGLCFCPNNAITRAEAAVIVARLGGHTSLSDAVEVSAELDDTSIPAWAISSMRKLAADGVLRGVLEAGVVSLAPYDVVTRASAAQMALALID